jgi:hypothetical protein
MSAISKQSFSGFPSADGTGSAIREIDISSGNIHEIDDASPRRETGFAAARPGKAGAEIGLPATGRTSHVPAWGFAPPAESVCRDPAAIRTACRLGTRFS